MHRFVIPLLAVCALSLAASAQPESIPPPRESKPFPALPADDAWGKLPPQAKPALPEWARVLAGPMPKTTAKMLELDYLHRVKNPLDPVLAARIRFTVAETLGSKYGQAVAEADWERASAATLHPSDVPPIGTGKFRGQEVAVAFARKLTLAGSAITDEEFAKLLKHFTPAEVTAIVHTVAYANFHNRILLGLGIKGEWPLAEPVGAKFDLDAAKVKAPDRPPWDDLKDAKGSGIRVRVDWTKTEFEELNKTLESQKERKLRMPLPDKKVFEKFPPREKMQAERIVWMTVSAGYQPEMTRAWFACLSAFYEEARFDRVFTNSVFWVVTRTNDCFY